MREFVGDVRGPAIAMEVGKEEGSGLGGPPCRKSEENGSEEEKECDSSRPASDMRPRTLGWWRAPRSFPTGTRNGTTYSTRLENRP